MIALLETKKYCVVFVGDFLEKIVYLLSIPSERYLIMEVKDGIYPRHVLSLEIRNQGSIPLTLTDENFISQEIEQSVAEFSYFLRVPIEAFPTKEWILPQHEAQNPSTIFNTIYLSSKQLPVRSHY
ncbi:hypothetical protein AMTRI_Chr06g169880 [Amborella trichopoda]